MSEWSKMNTDQQDYPVMLLESAARESEATGQNMLAGKSPYAELHLERAKGLRVAIGVLEAARVSRSAPEGALRPVAEPESAAAPSDVIEVKALPAQAGEGDQALVGDALVVGSREVGTNGKTKWEHGDHVRNRRTAEYGIVTRMQKSRAHFEEPDMFWMNGNKGPFYVKDFYRPGKDD